MHLCMLTSAALELPIPPYCLILLATMPASLIPVAARLEIIMNHPDVLTPEQRQLV